MMKLMTLLTLLFVGVARYAIPLTQPSKKLTLSLVAVLANPRLAAHKIRIHNVSIRDASGAIDEGRASVGILRGKSEELARFVLGRPRVNLDLELPSQRRHLKKVAFLFALTTGPLKYFDHLNSRFCLPISWRDYKFTRSPRAHFHYSHRSFRTDGLWPEKCQGEARAHVLFFIWWNGGDAGSFPRWFDGVGPLQEGRQFFARVEQQ